MPSSSNSIYVVTGNPDKVREFQQIIGNDWKLKPALKDFPGLDWDEAGDTFYDNALIKIHALEKLIDAPMISDDSGLCVDALAGAPGVYSARFSETGSNADNNAKLLDELRGVAQCDRSAHYQVCIVFRDSQGDIHRFEAKCPGEILETPRGEGGFGYDPLFLPKGYERSMAELSAAEKHQISHRGQALKAWKAFMMEQD